MRLCFYPCVLAYHSTSLARILYLSLTVCAPCEPVLERLQIPLRSIGREQRQFYRIGELDRTESESSVH